MSMLSMRQESSEPVPRFNTTISAIEQPKMTLKTQSSYQQPFDLEEQEDQPKEGGRAEEHHIVVKMAVPKNVDVSPAKQSDRKTVVDWLLSGLLVPRKTNFEQLHVDSKNGLFFFDLINKIERKTIMRGRTARNATNIKVIFQKVMDYFKKFEKFNPRYLGASYFLINGNYDVFWGFMLDICYHARNRICPYDPRYSSQQQQKKQIQKQRNQSSKRKDTNLKDVELEFKSNSREDQHIYIPDSQYALESESPQFGGQEGNRRKVPLNNWTMVRPDTNPSGANIVQGGQEIDQYLQESDTERKTSKFAQDDNERVEFMIAEQKAQGYGAHPTSKNIPKSANIEPNGTGLLNETFFPPNQKKYTTGSYARKHIKKTQMDRQLKSSRNAFQRSFIKEQKSQNPKLFKLGNIKDASTNSPLKQNQSLSTSQWTPKYIDFSNISKIKTSVVAWLGGLGFNIQDGLELFKDPLRNGYLLCILASKIYGHSIRGICKKPRTISECKMNLEIACKVFRENSEDFPYNLVYNSEGLLRGDPLTTWPLLSCLKGVYENQDEGVPIYPHMRARPDSFEQEYLMQQGGGVEGDGFLSSANIKRLPYSPQMIHLLCSSLQQWLQRKGLLAARDMTLSEFKQVLYRLGDGLFILRVVEAATKKKVTGVHPRPTSLPMIRHNIKKALDTLKNESKMSRRFLWKVDALVSPDFDTCLGLLEDLHRYSDGLPVREDPDYFKDGPYLPKASRTGAVNQNRGPSSIEDSELARQFATSQSRIETRQDCREEGDLDPSTIQSTHRDHYQFFKADPENQQLQNPGLSNNNININKGSK